MIKLQNNIYYRWLRIMSKSNEIPENTKESLGVHEWLSECADRMEEMDGELTDSRRQLKELTNILDEYLSYSSIDGKPERKRLRIQIKQFVSKVRDE
jgi:hypothetical protein